MGSGKGYPSDEMLRRVLQGELKDTRIRGFQLRLEEVSKKGVRISLLLVDKNNTVLSEYNDSVFTLNVVGSTVTVCDLDRLFDFRLVRG